MFERNMAYQSPVNSSPQTPIDYQTVWGEGVGPGVQLPPTDLTNLGKNTPEHTSSGVKHYPEGDRTASTIPKWLRYFASGGETLDPQERIDQNTQVLVAHAKAAAKTFGEIADELRSFGCINAAFKDGHVNLKFDRTVSSRIDALLDQHLPNMDHVRNFQYIEFTASIANDIFLNAFMAPFFAERMACRARPLANRDLTMTKGHSRELRFLRSINEPAYRSGFVGDKTVARLTERNVRTITPTFRPGYCGPPISPSPATKHFSQIQEYGRRAGHKFLENGRNRYYDIMQPARVEGEILGRIRVREWDPKTGLKRTWHETIDKNGVVRSVRPERNDGVKIHYIFDENGVFEGIR
jgi:hypothetical protein